MKGLVTETDRASDFKSRTRVIVELDWGNGKVCIFTGARFENFERVVLELIGTAAIVVNKIVLVVGLMRSIRMSRKTINKQFNEKLTYSGIAQQFFKRGQINGTEPSILTKTLSGRMISCVWKLSAERASSLSTRQTHLKSSTSKLSDTE